MGNHLQNDDLSIKFFCRILVNCNFFYFKQWNKQITKSIISWLSASTISDWVLRLRPAISLSLSLCSYHFHITCLFSFWSLEKSLLVIHFIFFLIRYFEFFFILLSHFDKEEPLRSHMLEFHSDFQIFFRDSTKISQESIYRLHRLRQFYPFLTTNKSKLAF